MKTFILLLLIRCYADRLGPHASEAAAGSVTPRAGQRCRCSGLQMFWCFKQQLDRCSSLQVWSHEVLPSCWAEVLSFIWTFLRSKPADRLILVETGSAETQTSCSSNSETLDFVCIKPIFILLLFPSLMLKFYEQSRENRSHEKDLSEAIKSKPWCSCTEAVADERSPVFF